MSKTVKKIFTVCLLCLAVLLLAGCSEKSVARDDIPLYPHATVLASSVPETAEILGGIPDDELFVLCETSMGQGGYETTGEAALFSEEFGDETVVKTETPSELYYTAYRIKKGDMIGVLAEQYGVTQDTLISVNNIKQTRYIQIDDYLRIPNMAGIVYTVRKDGETVESIAASYEVDAEKCATVNKLALADSLSAGTMLFVPDAELDWVTRQEINGDLFKRPIHSRNYWISSLFGWRASPFTGQRSYHSGIDLACAAWTPIYAALGGTVSTVCNTEDPTYGYYVIVTHHSGYKTLYGHMIQKPSVKVGQSVTTETVLGYVGSTGLSTGPHVHFTVYKNGVAVNPAALWN